MPRVKRLVKKRRADEGDRHIAARVKSRRLHLGLSQSELGEKVGVSFQQIQKYEKCTNRIGTGRLFQIAAVLAVRPGYFFEDPLSQITNDRERLGADIFDQFCASRDGTALMQAFVKIRSEDVQRAIAAFLQDLGD